MFEGQAVMRASVGVDAGKGDGGPGLPWFVPLAGNFEDSNSFYSVAERKGVSNLGQMLTGARAAEALPSRGPDKGDEVQ